MQKEYADSLEFFRATLISCRILHQLVIFFDNSKFRWTAQCEATFIKLKLEIGSDKTLTPCDPTLPIILNVG
ncbi:hypothetical protein CEXT_202211 [Caerostris extrusa]|uniref:Uncharacterized protein n=1 Tax=Caerostris extrusa TaxID=172846 RepID=A0AAV4T6J5_CAEEX|nr:hypothetical protein CEXT_202211 [Caerostris extrusa]